MTAIVSFYLIAILARRVKSHVQIIYIYNYIYSIGQLKALNAILDKDKTEMWFALLVLRTRIPELRNVRICLQ